MKKVGPPIDRSRQVVVQAVAVFSNMPVPTEQARGKYVQPMNPGSVATRHVAPKSISSGASVVRGGAILYGSAASIQIVVEGAILRPAMKTMQLLG